MYWLYPNYEYKNHGGIKDIKRKCPACNQWFMKSPNKPHVYIPINGVIIKKDCSCHNFIKRRLK